MEVVNNLNEYNQFCLWNDYCDANSYYDDKLYEMAEFNEFFRDTEPLDIIRCANENFSPNDDYFKFDGCGDPISCNYPDDVADWISVVDYCIQNDRDFGYHEIRDILEEPEEEDGLE